MNWLWKNVWWLARGVVALHAAFALVTWFRLPARIPTHFDLAGNPNDWSSRSLFAWFVLVAVSFGLQCLIQLLMSPAARDTWNMPEKERFLRLTRQQQEPVIQLMKRFGGFSGVCVSITFLGLQIGMYLVSYGYTKGFAWYIHAALFVPVAFLLIGLIPWSNAVQKAVLKASSP